jgi:hypothetical protein
MKLLRLLAIDAILLCEGNKLDRKTLSEYAGTSPAQTTRELSLYREMFPGNIVHGKHKHYHKSATYKSGLMTIKMQKEIELEGFEHALLKTLKRFTERKAGDAYIQAKLVTEGSFTADEVQLDLNMPLATLRRAVIRVQERLGVKITMSKGVFLSDTPAYVKSSEFKSKAEAKQFLDDLSYLKKVTQNAERKMK